MNMDFLCVNKIRKHDARGMTLDRILFKDFEDDFIKHQQLTGEFQRVKKSEHYNIPPDVG